MSGIAGLYADASPAPELLRAMIGRIAHRGRADQDIQVDGRVGLAIARPAGCADVWPLRSADGRFRMIADGALDGEGGWRGVLDAPAMRGEGLPADVPGAYALAIHDGDSGRLLLARDRVGARPLFFARTAYGWAFASEVKGLLPALLTPAIDPVALARYLQCGYGTGDRTLFAGVERLAPGELVILDAEGRCTRRRYRPPPTAERLDEAEAARRFEAVMANVLGRRAPSLLGDSPDAAVLLSLMDRMGAAPARVISLVTASDGGPGGGDRTDAFGALARRLGVGHAVHAVQDADLIRHLAPAVWAADDLSGDAGMAARLMLAGTLAPDDAPLMSAVGADTVFASDPAYRARRVHRWFDGLLEPGSGGFRARGAFRGQERLLFGPALQRATQDWRAPFVDAWQACAGGCSELQRMQHLDLRTLVPDRLLAGLDRPLMSRGIEWRAPWLDHRAVEFGFSLPDRLKAGRDGGFLQRRAQALLPRDWSQGQAAAPPRRPAIPIGAWLSGPTLDRLEAVLLASVPMRAWFQPEGISRLVASKRAGNPVSRRLFSLLQFALWHRIFIETDAERPDPCDPLDFLEG